MKGLVISTIVWLIIAIACLILLWILFPQLVDAIITYFENIKASLKKLLCDKLGALGWLTSICRPF
jgi:hypothetical protein